RHGDTEHLKFSLCLCDSVANLLCASQAVATFATACLAVPRQMRHAYNRDEDETVQALAFWKAVTVDDSNLLERFFELLRIHKVRFCLIGGQAVNAYAEPVVSLDLDVVIASARVADVEPLLRKQFDVERFEHSLNV